MKRTTIRFDDSLNADIERIADAMNISKNQLVNQMMETMILAYERGLHPVNDVTDAVKEYSTVSIANQYDPDTPSEQFRLSSESIRMILTADQDPVLNPEHIGSYPNDQEVVADMILAVLRFLSNYDGKAVKQVDDPDDVHAIEAAIEEKKGVYGAVAAAHGTSDYLLATYVPLVRDRIYMEKVIEYIITQDQYEQELERDVEKVEAGEIKKMNGNALARIFERLKTHEKAIVQFGLASNEEVEEMQQTVLAELE